MKRLLALVLPILVLATLAVQPLYSQFETASVLGYVRDASGAFVQNAAVTLTNTDTQTAVTVQTGSQGSYQFTDVKIGQYQVAANASGFGVSTSQVFTVTVNAHQRVFTPQSSTLRRASASPSPPI